jgi:hypothetical protein
LPHVPFAPYSALCVRPCPDNRVDP